jgi:hypothetical protein
MGGRGDFDQPDNRNCFRFDAGFIPERGHLPAPTPGITPLAGESLPEMLSSTAGLGSDPGSQLPFGGRSVPLLPRLNQAALPPGGIGNCPGIRVGLLPMGIFNRDRGRMDI